MKYTKTILGTFATLAMSGAFIASAHMGGDMDKNIATRFESEAKILGVTTDEVKNAWADGKNIFDLAKEKGIATTTLKANMDVARDAEIKTKMDALVKSGTITQAQADKRIATMKAQDLKKASNKKGGKMKDVKGERKEIGKRGGFMGF
jgi:hypothetical protein